LNHGVAMFKTGRQPKVIDPTPEEIRERAAIERKSWTKERWQKAGGWQAEIDEHWTPPEIDCGDLSEDSFGEESI